ncbi:hypothetical protein Aeh1ORF138c [Aeromonas phage Aeh1]|uniref:Uncharacterized protein n=1 Tax=Aeromonas phage Aeh1 TaxID=2880362 RepID=Q76YU3_9CAUD|nr:hypothetical protein Aeh1p148 [Aeromonas phage Aeh1]AAQ17803.1 hypothetical protein Aeh1ORF138c [Aeromonas phage Aeh1]
MIKIIKASAGAGKTSKAIELAVEEAKKGKYVVFLNNEETQESIVGKISDIDTDFGDGEIAVGEVDGVSLTALQDAVHNAAVELGRERKIDVVVLDFSGYADFNGTEDRLEKLRSYIKRIEAVHEIDVIFTIQVIRKSKGVTRPTVAEIWKDRDVKSKDGKTPACFDNVDMVSIDVTKASPMLQDRETQTIIYQDMTGMYVGKYVDFKYYGFKS